MVASSDLRMAVPPESGLGIEYVWCVYTYMHTQAHEWAHTHTHQEPQTA